ncbi:MAG: hypothetical protein QXF12_02505 [Candidatus Aenigmatarchaeota archaeon]
MNSMLSNSFLFQRCSSISPLNYYLPFKKHYLVYRTMVYENYADVKTKYIPSKMAFLGNKKEMKNYVNKLQELYSGYKIEHTNQHIAFYRNTYEHNKSYRRHNIFYFDGIQNTKINSLYDLVVSEIEKIDISDPNSSIRSFVLLSDTNEFNYFINGVFTKNYHHKIQKVSIRDIFWLEKQKYIDSGTVDEREFAILHINGYEMFKKASAFSSNISKMAKKISEKILQVYEDNKEKININIKIDIKNKKADVDPVLNKQFKLALTFNAVGLLHNSDESIIGFSFNGSLDLTNGEQTHNISAHVNFVLASKGTKGKFLYYVYTYDTTSAPPNVYRTGRLDQIEKAKTWNVIDIVLDTPFDNLLTFEHEIFQDKLVLHKIFG